VTGPGGGERHYSPREQIVRALAAILLAVVIGAVYVAAVVGLMLHGSP
jgi:hypothetical protein